MLSVRLYNAADRLACLELLRRGHDSEFSAERFDWLHEESPLAPSPRVVCCDGERVVGFHAAIRKRVLLAGVPLVGARDVDPVVDPDYRGRGVFKRLLDFALETFDGVDFYFNFANDVSRPGFLSRGWRVAGLLRDAVCQLGYRRPFSADHLLHLVTGARARPGQLGTATRIDLADLVGAGGLRPAAPRGRLWVERSAAYLMWRYARSPLHRYDCYALPAGDRPRKAIVVRHDETLQRLLVLDVLSADADDLDLTPLLPALRSAYPGARAFLWSTSPPRARRAFLINPFRRDSGYPLLVREAPGRALPAGWDRGERMFIVHGDVEYL